MRNIHKAITDLYSENSGRISDRWTRYLSEYDKLFKELRHEPIRMLEIGVQNGGGLEIWAQYFTKGALFIGCDINPDCASLHFEDPRIKIVIGNANSDRIEKQISSYSPTLDIVIDDGSHVSADVIHSFVRYFPNLVDGGIYVAEDLHTSYWDDYGGGLFAPLSSVSFFKRLVDIINFEHWGVERDRTSILAGFFEEYGLEMNPELLLHIHSIKFINSLCIIEKSSPADNVLGTRFISGVLADVCNDMKQFHGSLLVAPTQSLNPWSIRVRPPDEQVPELETQLRTLNSSLLDLREKLNAAEQEIQSVNIELGEIYRSQGWQFVVALRRLRLRLVPPGSTREQIVRLIIRTVRYWQAHGFRGLTKRISSKKRASSKTARSDKRQAPAASTENNAEINLAKTDLETANSQPHFKPLPIFITPFRQPRLSLMIGDHPTSCPFGRTAITLIFSTFLAEKLGYDFRIISNGGSMNKQYVGDILRTNSISWTHNIDFLSIGPDDPRAEIPVGAGDVFLTTSWDIAANLLNGIDATKVIYLLLEDERIKLLASKQSNQCQEILRNEKIKFVVNTKRLYDHFGSSGLENICKSGAWFEPAWQETLFFPDEGRPDGRKNFLYTLPADAGDEFCQLIESALDGAIQKGIFNQDEWNFFGVSKTAFQTKKSHPFLLKRYQDMDCLRYLSLARKTDLCIAMTGKPFLLPDYHPFDLLACGAVVVSNYSDESPDMIPHWGNLIHSNAQVDEIIQCLARGVELVNQADLRFSNFQMNTLHKDWRTSFEGILSSIESWDFNVPA